jgi:hypothetical protein
MKHDDIHDKNLAFCRIIWINLKNNCKKYFKIAMALYENLQAYGVFKIPKECFGFGNFGNFKYKYWIQTLSIIKANCV